MARVTVSTWCQQGQATTLPALQSRSPHYSLILASSSRLPGLPTFSPQAYLSWRYQNLKISKRGAGEMAQQLGALRGPEFDSKYPHDGSPPWLWIIWCPFLISTGTRKYLILAGKIFIYVKQINLSKRQINPSSMDLFNMSLYMYS